MKIEYIFKHFKDKDIQKETFTLDKIEQGKSLDYVYYMEQDGYTLIDRVFVEHDNK